MSAGILDTGDSEKHKAGDIPALTELTFQLWGKGIGMGKQVTKEANEELSECQLVINPKQKSNAHIGGNFKKDLKQVKKQAS